MDLLTNSRSKSFHACPRKHHNEYVLGYRPVERGTALEFGDIFHGGLEAWWLAFMRGMSDQALDLAREAMDAAKQKAERHDEVADTKADLLMLGYHARWSGSMDEYEVIGVEQEFRAPLANPATGRRCRGLQLAGKLDVLVRKRVDGTVWFVEHKTSGVDLSAGADYWQRLRMDGQVSIYHAGVKALGYDVYGCLYDVIAKPDQRPYQATPEENRTYTKEVVKNGVVVSPRRLYAKQREFPETMDEFKARMAELIMADPGAYFQRVEVVRTEAELAEAARDTYQTAMAMRDGRKAGWAPRNTDACMNFKRLCEFYPTCSGTATLDDEGLYKRLNNVHPELSNE